MPFILNSSVGRLRKGIGSLEDVDFRELVILAAIFEFQQRTSEGISWGELLGQKAIQGKMSRQTFSHRLRGLLDRGILKKDVEEQ
jgi:hypothetical protein